jgi:hypothetical protein
LLNTYNFIQTWQLGSKADELSNAIKAWNVKKAPYPEK